MLTGSDSGLGTSLLFPSNDIAASGQRQNYGNPMCHGSIRHILSADAGSTCQLAFPRAGIAMPCVEIDGQTYFYRPEAEISDFQEVAPRFLKYKIGSEGDEHGKETFQGP
jgi:hypothetical protein